MAYKNKLHNVTADRMEAMQVVPSTLNGYKVIGAGYRKGATGVYVVAIHLHDNPVTPWAVVSWWPSLGDCWEFGHYHNRRVDAVVDYCLREEGNYLFGGGEGK